ncbi:MAG: ketohydroxyglutarate aldolase [Actinomycetota bacterium]|nr:ketohydroxyglutarate aldolase [Actinomycetota bacterium]
MSEQEPQEPRPVEVSVLVNGEHLSSIDAVAKALESAGLRVSAVMGTVGVITGTTDDPDQLGTLEQLDGVDSVEVTRKIQLPPPDSPIQ